MKREETNLNFKYDSSPFQNLSKSWFFLIIEKQGPPLFEKRNDFIWSNTRHRREFVELKIQKLFFRAFEFWFFQISRKKLSRFKWVRGNWQSGSEKRTGYFKLLTGRHVIMSSVPNDIEFDFCRTQVEMNFGRSKTLFEAKIKLIWFRVKFENRFKQK